MIVINVVEGKENDQTKHIVNDVLEKLYDVLL